MRPIIFLFFLVAGAMAIPPWGLWFEYGNIVQAFGFGALLMNLVWLKS